MPSRCHVEAGVLAGGGVTFGVISSFSAPLVVFPLSVRHRTPTSY